MGWKMMKYVSMIDMRNQRFSRCPGVLCLVLFVFFLSFSFVLFFLSFNSFFVCRRVRLVPSFGANAKKRENEAKFLTFCHIITSKLDNPVFASWVIMVINVRNRY